MATISLEGLEKPAVLAALYNAAKPQGMGFMQYDPAPMTFDEAKAILDQGYTDFDYLKGRVMKINLSGDEFDPWLFDRNNGEGAAQRAIDSLQETGDTNNPLIEDMHKHNTMESAENTEGMLDEKTTVKDMGNAAVMNLGLSDMKEHLAPKIKEAKDKIRSEEE
jgi:hypothetical protein